MQCCQWLQQYYNRKEENLDENSGILTRNFILYRLMNMSQDYDSVDMSVYLSDDGKDELSIIVTMMKE